MFFLFQQELPPQSAMFARSLRACAANSVRAVPVVRPKVVIVGTGWASFRVLADIDTKKNDVTAT